MIVLNVLSTIIYYINHMCFGLKFKHVPIGGGVV